MNSNKIIVIEDDEDIRSSMKDILEFEGYQVRTACNGKEGLELLRGSAFPCVILLDLMMPIMNGWEFLAACRADARLVNIPIVVLTAGDARSPEGATRFIKKPTDIEDILKVVEEYCGRPGDQ